MPRDQFAAEEVQAQVERGYAASERAAHMERIGANHYWPACPYCGDGTPNSAQRSILTDEGYAHPACADTMDFLNAEEWGLRTRGITMHYLYEF